MELQRAPVEIPNVDLELAEQRRKLLEDAEAVLGYRHAANQMRSRKEESAYWQASAKMVKEALEKAGILPFAQQAVEQYKKQRVRALRRKYWLRNYVNSQFGEVMMWVSAIGGLCSVLVTIIIACSIGTRDVKLPLSHGDHLFVVGFVTAAVVGLVSWIGSSIVRGLTYRTRYNFQWVINEFSTIHRDVPDFALADALAIKKVLPDASLRVEELAIVEEQRNRVVNLDPDPFLVLTAGNRRYYIDVWDEEDFERQQ